MASFMKIKKIRVWEDCSWFHKKENTEDYPPRYHGEYCSKFMQEFNKDFQCNGKCFRYKMDQAT